LTASKSSSTPPLMCSCRVCMWCCRTHSSRQMQVGPDSTKDAEHHGDRACTCARSRPCP
jgi:hypothetical protein